MPAAALVTTLRNSLRLSLMMPSLTVRLKADTTYEVHGPPEGGHYVRGSLGLEEQAFLGFRNQAGRLGSVEQHGHGALPLRPEID